MGPHFSTRQKTNKYYLSKFPDYSLRPHKAAICRCKLPIRVCSTCREDEVNSADGSDADLAMIATRFEGLEMAGFSSLRMISALRIIST